jgi:hypothetical protein
MEGISQAWKNMVNYKRRNLVVASDSPPAASFCRMVLAPDKKTMVPDDTFRPVYVRPVKLYNDGDNPLFPRTNIPTPRNRPESAFTLNAGYEPEPPEADSKTLAQTGTTRFATARVLKGSLQNKAAREQSLGRVKFLIAVEDIRVKFLNSNEGALGDSMNKSGIALFGIKNSCEETYKDVYAKYFDISYEQEISGHKHHAEILRSAHIYADQIAQACLSGLDDDAQKYGKFLSQFELTFDVSGIPKNYALRSNETTAWWVAPIPAIVDAETRL